MPEVIKPNSDIRYLLALAIVKKMWVAGLITEDEMNRINKRNKESFCCA
jgi:hypothetical protein